MPSVTLIYSPIHTYNIIATLPLHFSRKVYMNAQDRHAIAELIRLKLMHGDMKRQSLVQEVIAIGESEATAFSVIDDMQHKDLLFYVPVTDIVGHRFRPWDFVRTSLHSKAKSKGSMFLYICKACLAQLLELELAKVEKLKQSRAMHGYNMLDWTLRDKWLGHSCQRA